MIPSRLEIISSVLFFLAIIHTFLVSKIEMVAHKFDSRTLQFKLFHLLSDVELVFAFWSLIFLLFSFSLDGFQNTFHFIGTLNFKEALLVFVIMCIAATRSIIIFAENLIHSLASFIPLPSRISFYLMTLIVGPLLGSLITEPAAMAMTALILLEVLYTKAVSQKFKYATLALLLVNVSIGGTLTHFAAPPVLMIAEKWNWNTFYMFTHFGYKAIIAIILSTSFLTFLFRRELRGELILPKKKGHYLFIHLAFLIGIVLSTHNLKIIFGIFLLFFIFMRLTKSVQDSLKWKEALMVATFLAGLVVLGTMQAWWLQTILSSMNNLTLFFGSTLLTSITDNAALTYLGSLVDLTESSKYALMSGAVAGGGLTIIANAPNPIAFGVLKDHFGEEGINPIKLLIWALIPTIIAVFSFLVLPS